MIMSDKDREQQMSSHLRALRERLRAQVGVDDGDLDTLTEAAQMIEDFDKERERLNYAIEMAPG
jgi:chemotaxis regulatin CheY-phosphate phosphatase CheZ